MIYVEHEHEGPLGPVQGICRKLTVHPHKPHIRARVKSGVTYAPMGQHKYYSSQAIFSLPSVNFAYSHTNGHCYNYHHFVRTGGFRYYRPVQL
jgi:hypothetical protein